MALQFDSVLMDVSPFRSRRNRTETSGIILESTVSRVSGAQHTNYVDLIVSHCLGIYIQFGLATPQRDIVSLKVTKSSSKTMSLMTAGITDAI